MHRRMAGRSASLLVVFVTSILLQVAYADLGGSGPEEPGSPDYWVKLKGIKLSEGKLQPPFSQDETEYTVNISNPGADHVMVIPELELTKYNLINVPKISVDGNETKYSPLGAIQLRFNLSDNGDYAPLDKVIKIKLADPSEGFETQQKTYKLTFKQPPNFEKVVSATGLAVYGSDGTELAMEPTFDRESSHNQYTVLLEPETTSVDVLLSCQDAANRIAYEGRPKNPGERYSVELPSVRKSLMATCEYSDPIYTKSQPLSRAYILKFIKNIHVGDLTVSISMLAGHDGFCQQKNLSDWQEGWNCETPAQVASILAFFDEKKAELDLVCRTTGVKYVLQNGLPTEVPAPTSGRDQYDVELVAGEHHATYHMTIGNFTWLASHGMSIVHTTTTTTTTWAPLKPGTFFFHSSMNVSADADPDAEASSSSSSSESVGAVPQGGEVVVVEVRTFPVHVERGRIEHPAGWITLSDPSSDEKLATKKLATGVYTISIPMTVSAHAEESRVDPATGKIRTLAEIADIYKGEKSVDEIMGYWSDTCTPIDSNSTSGSNSSSSESSDVGVVQTIPEGAEIDVDEIRFLSHGLQRGRIKRPCKGWITLSTGLPGENFGTQKSSAPPINLDEMKIFVEIPETDGECREWHHAGSFFCRTSVPSTMARIKWSFAVYGPGTLVYGREHTQSLELKAPIQGVHRYKVIVHDSTERKATINVYTAQEILPTFSVNGRRLYRQLMDLPVLEVLVLKPVPDSALSHQQAPPLRSFGDVPSTSSALWAVLLLGIMGLSAVGARRWRKSCVEEALSACEVSSCCSNWQRSGRPPDDRQERFVQRDQARALQCQA